MLHFYYKVCFPAVTWTQMKAATILKSGKLYISGNPNHFRPLPSNKETQNEALVHFGLQLLTCVGSPVLTCIRGKLKAGDHPISRFNSDVTLRMPQASPGNLLSVRKLSNHVCRLPTTLRSFQQLSLTRSFLGLVLKCDVFVLH